MPNERLRAMHIERELDRICNDLALQDEELEVLSLRFDARAAERSQWRRARSSTSTRAVRV